MAYKLNTKQVEDDFMNVEFDSYDDIIVAYKGGIFYEINKEIPRINLSDGGCNEITVYPNMRGEIKARSFGMVGGKKLFEAMEAMKKSFRNYYNEVFDEVIYEKDITYKHNA